MGLHLLQTRCHLLGRAAPGAALRSQRYPYRSLSAGHGSNWARSGRRLHSRLQPPDLAFVRIDRWVTQFDGHLARLDIHPRYWKAESFARLAERTLLVE